MSDPIDPHKEYTVDELLLLTGQWIAEIEAEAEIYEERRAIEAEAIDDGLNTDQRAIAALQRPERFPGEHEVARAWLRRSNTALITRIKKREA